MLSFEAHLANLSRKQRLSLATMGAIGLHVILFASGWLVIQKISVPSNVNRAMVLTLESTPLDGLATTEVNASETVNDAKNGEIASMPDRPKLSELSQLSTVPYPKATFELNPELRPVPLPEVASASHARTDTLADRPLEQHVVKQTTPHSTQPYLDREGGRQLGELLNFNDPLAPPQQTLDDLLTADQGALQVTQTESELVETISSEQQRMVERKIQKWASKIEATQHVDKTFSWQHKGQTYAAKFTYLPASGPMDLDEMIVEVTTTEDGRELSTVMRLKKLAFSNFAQFVHRWDPSVMIHDDEMQGRFHSNSQILVDFDRRTRPIFHGKVTTASYRIDFESTARRKTRNEIFRGGLETGVKKIKMPRAQMLFTNTAETSASDTITFNEDTRLVFTADGGLMYERSGQVGTPRYMALPPHPIYLIAKDGVTLSVSGKVRGKIMVYSPSRILIEGEITYADQNFEETDDVIGLISGKDVVIAGEKVTGLGDLEVNASIYAGRRFVVRDYARARNGTLKIFGSVSAGSVTATQPRFGTHIVFDTRFEKIRPPGFPITDRYEVSQSDGIWRPSN